MSVEYKIMLTRMRDQAALAFAVSILQEYMKASYQGQTGPMDNNLIAEDAWNMAEEFVRERERRYGPVIEKTGEGDENE